MVNRAPLRWRRRPSATACSTSGSRAAAAIIARQDRIPVWALSNLFIGVIGLGFMFTEITLMQIMSMFLGHPTYGLGVVLFSRPLKFGKNDGCSTIAPT